MSDQERDENLPQNVGRGSQEQIQPLSSLDLIRSSQLTSFHSKVLPQATKKSKKEPIKIIILIGIVVCVFSTIVWNVSKNEKKWSRQDNAQKLRTILETSKPVQGSIKFECSPQQHQGWSSSQAHASTVGEYRFEKVPYENVNLIQDAVSSSSPDYHFSEVVTFLRHYPIQGSIFIHSSPVYLALLIGAVTDSQVKIVISSKHPEKRAIKAAFVINRLTDKVQVAAPGQDLVLLQKASLTVTSSSLFADCQAAKDTLLITSSSAKNPVTKGAYRIESVPSCSPLKIASADGQLRAGTYFIKRSEVPSKQCANTQFTYSPVQVKPEEKGAQQLRAILETSKPVQGSIKFECSPQQHQGWSSSQAHASTVGEYRFEKVPYENVNLIQDAVSSSSPDYHFSEVVTFLRHYPIQGSIFIHSSPVYLALLIGAVTDSQVKIVISSKHPEKRAIKAAFVINRLTDKVQVAAPGQDLVLLQKASLTVTSSSLFADCQAAKDTLLITSSSDPVTKGAYRIESVPSCSPLKIAFADGQLRAGTYFIKRSEVPSKQCANTQFTYSPVQVKPEEKGAQQLRAILETSKPVQGSIKFECSPQQHQGWSSSQAHASTVGEYRFEKVPYENVNLIQDAVSSSSPDYHFSEVVTFLRHYPIQGSIFIHSSPVYLALLIGAVTDSQVKIVISSKHPEKRAIKAAFVINRLTDKVQVAAPGQDLVLLQKASLTVTSSSLFADCQAAKDTLLITSSSDPVTKGAYRIESVPSCSPLKIAFADGQLRAGTYFIKRSEVPSKQCANTQFTYSPVQVKPEEKGAQQLRAILETSKPVQGSIKFECSPQQHQGWSSSQAHASTVGEYRFEKVPYENVNLIQDAVSSSSPDYHFSEVVTFLRHYPIQGSIFIHSSPVYLALLIGAVTDSQVKIVISSKHPEKRAIKAAFVINRLTDKVQVAAPGQDLVLLQKASLTVTSSSLFADCQAAKDTLLITSSSDPVTKGAYRIESVPSCSPLKIAFADGQLRAGTYFIKRSEVPSKQCANTQFTYSPVQVKPEEKGAQQLRAILETSKPVQGSIKFECSPQQHQGWSSSQAHASIVGEYRFEKVPYENVNLIQDAVSSSSPDYHFSEVVTFLRHYPIQGIIFIHSSPVYLALLIGAVTDSQVKIVISSKYPEKRAIKAAFVINRLTDKVQVAAPGQDLVLLQKASLTVTSSSLFADCQAAKDTLLITSSSAKNPVTKGAYRIESVPSCSPLKIAFADGQLRAGTYFIKRSEVPSKQCANTQFTYSPVQVKPEEKGAQQLRAILETSKPVQGSIKFECSPQQHQGWSSSQAHASIVGEYRFEKVPYENVNLIQDAVSSSSPDYHFSEVVTFLRHYPIQGSIFIHSSPVYLALLIGAVTDSQVKIVISSKHPEKRAIKAAFVINRLTDKVQVAAPGQDLVLLQKASLTVTSSSLFADCQAAKDTLLITSSSAKNPVTKGAYRIESVPSCSPLKIAFADGQLRAGTYFIKRSEVPSKQCANTQFTYSPVQVKPEEKGAQQLRAILETSKPVQGSIKFECSPQQHQGWSSSQAHASTVGEYRFEKVPYENVNLIQDAVSSSSPDYHFSEVVTFLRHYPIQGSIFIHSSPVYLALLIGAVTDSQVKIVISSKHPEKRAIKAAFVINRLTDKVQVAAPGQDLVLLQKASLTVTSSSLFADCQAAKDTLLITSSSAKNPVTKGAYRIESVPSCSPLKIASADGQLRAGTYFIKRSEVPSKQCANTQFTYSPVQVKPEEKGAQQLRAILETSKPVQGSIKFECSPQQHQGWSSSQAHASTVGEYRFEKVPYENVNLIQDAVSSSSPDYHFSEVVTFLRHYPIQGSIFIHSSPVYLALLIGAVTDSQVKIVISSKHPEKRAIKAAFVINRLTDKVQVAAPGQDLVLLQKASLTVTSSSLFADCQAAKDTLLITSSSAKNPVTKGAYRIESVPSCSPLKIAFADGQLRAGTYFIKRSEVPSKQCANTQFTYSPVQVKPEEKGAQQLRAILETSKPVQGSIKFECSPQQHQGWSSSQAHASIVGEYRFEKVPYENVNLIQDAVSSSSPDYHFSEVVTFLRHYPIQGNIFIHSSPVYLALLIGAVTDSQVKIVISSKHPEKRAIKAAFVINRLTDKVQVAAPGQDLVLLQKASLTVTSSSLFADCQAAKDTLLITSSSAKNPVTKGAYRIESVPSCSPLKIAFADGQLRAGTYFIKRSEVPSKQCANTQFTYSPVQVKPEEKGAQQLRAILETSKPVQGSIKFECSPQQHQGWSSSQAHASIVGEYRFEKVPYENVNLIQDAVSSSSPDYHFSEVVTFLRHYPIQGSIFIHSSPVYLALLIGAVTDSQVKIVISSKHPEKRAIKAAFVINRLTDKVQVAAPGQDLVLLQKASLTVTSSSLFADCQAAKDTLLITSSSAKNPVTKGAYRIESVPSCSPLKIAFADGQLRAGTYFIKRSEVPSKQCANTQFTYSPVQVKPEEKGAQQLRAILETSKPVQGSIKFECSPQQHQGWSSSQAHASTVGEYRFEKVPYENVNLIQDAVSSSSPDYHFSEVVTFLRHYPIQGSIFIHSSPVYLALLIGAVTDSQVKIVISSKHPEKRAIKAAFVINRLTDKVQVAAPGQDLVLLQKASLTVTSSSLFADCQAAKDTLLITSSSAKNPVTKGAYRIESVPSCSPLKIAFADGQLRAGTYFIKRSEVPSKQCANTQFTYSPVQVKPEEKGAQ